jgi:hypothetical protein
MLVPPAGFGLGERKAPAPAANVKVLVLDDCDGDFQTAPFDDAVLLATAAGHVERHIGGLNVCETIGGCRAVTASEEGTFFVVCENVADKITAYEAASGHPLWSSPGEFTAAVIHQHAVYALKTAGAIYGKEIVVFDSSGGIVRRAAVGGYDIAADPNANVLWLVGADIKKCDTGLNVLWQIDPIKWCASSVDVAPDGSAWVAERQHVQAGGANRLLHISPDGVIRKDIPLDLSPMCVRLDPVDSSLWVTGLRLDKRRKLYFTMRDWPHVIGFREEYRTIGWRTCKYSTQGKLLCQLEDGGASLDLDPSDGSVWIGGRSKVWHCSRGGTKLDTLGGASDSHKWICIVPQSR